MITNLLNYINPAVRYLSIMEKSVDATEVVNPGYMEEAAEDVPQSGYVPYGNGHVCQENGNTEQDMPIYSTPYVYERKSNTGGSTPKSTGSVSADQTNVSSHLVGGSAPQVETEMSVKSPNNLGPGKVCLDSIKMREVDTRNAGAMDKENADKAFSY